MFEVRGRITLRNLCPVGTPGINLNYRGSSTTPPYIFMEPARLQSFSASASASTPGREEPPSIAAYIFLFGSRCFESRFGASLISAAPLGHVSRSINTLYQLLKLLIPPRASRLPQRSGPTGSVYCNSAQASMCRPEIKRERKAHDITMTFIAVVYHRFFLHFGFRHEYPQKALSGDTDSCRGTSQSHWVTISTRHNLILLHFCDIEGRAGFPGV